MNQRATFSLMNWSAQPKQKVDLELADPRFDVATAIHMGARQYQQDALIADFPAGEDLGIGILADGMGGQLGGDVASAVAVSTAFCELKTQLVGNTARPQKFPDMLKRTAGSVNEAIAQKIAAVSTLQGMGTTLIASLILGPHLYWVSVGDSPLYLYRDGTLKRLNADHSMAPQIDAMSASGLISAELAAEHPQRHVLTSAICGDRIPQIDCPATPFDLQVGDIVVLASDGLQTLSDTEIRNHLTRKRRRRSDEITQSLMQAVLSNADDQQDNVSVMVVKVLSTADATPREVQQEKTEDGSIEQASDLLNVALRL